MDRERIAGLIRELLQQLGEDPAREGLVKTPMRVAEALEFLTSGYRGNAGALLEKAIFVQETHSMMMRGVEKQNSMMTTSAMLGGFRTSVPTRTEFLTLIGRHRP